MYKMFTLTKRSIGEWKSPKDLLNTLDLHPTQDARPRQDQKNRGKISSW